VIILGAALAMAMVQQILSLACKVEIGGMSDKTAALSRIVERRRTVLGRLDAKNPEFTGWATWGGDAARTGVYQSQK
jgi:hypothetical protein